jgi:hypothetical protein
VNKHVGWENNMKSNAPFSGRLDAPGVQGSGVRAFGARVAGVLLLVLGLGLCYLGVVWGIQEPFESTRGTIVVESCEHDEGRKSAFQWCDGTFTSDDGKVEDPYASVDTDDPYAKGDRVGVYRLGEESSSYNPSLADASASGFRALFAGLGVLGPVIYVLITGSWPTRRSPAAKRPIHPVFWKVSFPLVCFGLLGLVVASIVKAIA